MKTECDGWKSGGRGTPLSLTELKGLTKEDQGEAGMKAWVDRQEGEVLCPLLLLCPASCAMLMSGEQDRRKVGSEGYASCCCCCGPARVMRGSTQTPRGGDHRVSGLHELGLGLRTRVAS